MPDLKISQLPAASTPLAGTELVPVVQGGITEQTPVQSLLTSTVPSGTANGVMYLNGSKVATTGGALTFDGSNLGLGVTPSAWFSDRRAMQLGSGASVNGSSATSSFVEVGANFYQNASAADTYVASSTASKYRQLSGVHSWFTAPSGTAGNAISFTQAMTLDASGNLMVGGTGETYRISSIKNTATSGLETNFIATNQTDSNFAISVSGSAASDKRARIGTVSNTALTFATADTERMRLDSSGNLGIGTTPSAWGANPKSITLHTGAFISGSGVRYQMNLGVNAYESADDVWRYAAAIQATRYTQYDGAHYWLTAPSGTGGNVISFTQAMTLDASGKLLVGRTSSSTTIAALKVEAESRYVSVNTGVAGYSFGTSGSAFVINDVSSGSSETERARIDSSGNFIHQVNGTAPSLSTNSTMSFELTSNTSLKIVVRGTDGVTRSASLTLA